MPKTIVKGIVDTLKISEKVETQKTILNNKDIIKGLKRAVKSPYLSDIKIDSKTIKYLVEYVGKNAGIIIPTNIKNTKNA